MRGSGYLHGMSLFLGVNIDHVATVRQARYPMGGSGARPEPCPVEAGHDAMAGGADSLTIHVRGDRRHMQDADAFRIREEVPLPLNLEMGVTVEMLDLALRLRPDFVCLVPESRQEITTEGGLDVVSGLELIRLTVARLKEAGIKVSLFIDPDGDQVAAARDTGAEMVELHTGCFANSTGAAVDQEVGRLLVAAKAGHACGLRVNAGHGINYLNISKLWVIPNLAELNIGHSIVSRALRVGMTSAVREMKHLMLQYPLSPRES